MTPNVFLLLNLALAFYNVGTIWAHEVDIFRSWKLISAADFPRVQQAHWRKLPYWVLAPVGVSFVGAVVLIGYHPVGSPSWAVWAGLGCQLSAHVLTAATWGRWQARLSRDPLGPTSPWLTRILATHWIRTALINAYGAVMVIWTVAVLA